MKTYYKVVTQKLQSASEDVYYVNYKIGDWAYPNVKNSKLFVFDNYLSAKSFAGSSRSIYSCHVKNPVKPKYIAYNNNLIEFWKAKSQKKKICQDHVIKVKETPMLSGTVFVDAVKLIKKVN